ncbi:MAG: BatD family protein [Verrucomicrobiota bacterium]
MERLLGQNWFEQRKRAWITCVASLWLGLFAGVGAPFAASFTTALERDTITLGESVRLELTFEGVQPKDPPTPPSIANLQIAYNGQASQYQIINGQSTSSVTHNFTITPRQAGDYLLPAMSIKAGANSSLRSRCD